MCSSDLPPPPPPPPPPPAPGQSSGTATLSSEKNSSSMAPQKPPRQRELVSADSSKSLKTVPVLANKGGQGEAEKQSSKNPFCDSDDESGGGEGDVTTQSEKVNDGRRSEGTKRVFCGSPAAASTDKWSGDNDHNSNNTGKEKNALERANKTNAKNLKTPASSRASNPFGDDDSD